MLSPAQTQPVLGGGHCVSKIYEYTQSGLKVLDDMVYIAETLLGTIGSLKKYFPMV